MKLEDLDSDMLDTFFKVAKFYFFKYHAKPYLTRERVSIAINSVRKFEVSFPFENPYHRDTVIEAMIKTGLIEEDDRSLGYYYYLTDKGYEFLSVVIL